MITTNSKLTDIDIKNKNVIIVGEMHGSAHDYRFIDNLIGRYKPDVVLHELFINLECKTVEEKMRYLAKVEADEDIPETYPMYPSLDALNLSLLKGKYIPFIGIDYTANWQGVSPDTMEKYFELDKKRGNYVRTFEIRESRMMHVIGQYLKFNKILVVVGDTHLRTIETEELGPISPIHKVFSNKPNALIIRSVTREID